MIENKKKLAFILLILVGFFCFINLSSLIDTDKNEEFDNHLPSVSSEDIHYEWILESSFHIARLKIDSQDNIYIAGWSGDYLHIAKYNTSGDLLLEIVWLLGYNTFCRGIEIDSEGNIYACGIYDGFSFIIKFNKSGDYQWDDTWDGYPSSQSIGIDSSNNIYITGSIDTAPNGPDISLLKYNNLGNRLWTRTWGGSEEDRGEAIRVDQSDNIFIAGYTRSFGTGREDMCIIKYDSSGNFMWDYVWGGELSDYGNILTFDTYNNVYLGGRTYSYGEGDADICILKFDNDGTLISYHTWGTTEREVCGGLEFDNSGNLYAIGTQEYRPNPDSSITVSKLCIVRFTNNLEFDWYMSHPVNDYWDYGGARIGFDSHNNIYLTGYKGNFPSASSFLMKCKPNEIRKKPLLERAISLTTYFSTSLELGIGGIYSDKRHEVTATFRIVAYTDSLTIEVTHDSAFIQLTKVIIEEKTSHNKTNYNISEKNRLKIESYRNYVFVFYLSYTHSYRSCIEHDGTYCLEDEWRTAEGETFSDDYDFNPNNPSIRGISLLFILGIIFTTILYVFKTKQNIIKYFKN